MVLGFGDPTNGMTRIWGHFVILVGCECVILRPQIMLRNKPELLQKFFELFDFLILDKDNLKYPKSLLKSSNDFIPIVIYKNENSTIYLVAK